MTTPGQVTQILHRMDTGDRDAFDELFPLIYRELRAVASKYMSGERAGQTLQATALTHEAYLRLLGEGISDFNDRAHFFAVAARAMRQILIERARAKRRKKRGGDLQRITLLPDIAGGSSVDLDVLALETALVKLARSHPRKARVVELLYFGGMTGEEVAVVVGVTRRTIERDWRFARLWLLREIMGNFHQNGGDRADAGA